MLDIKLDINIMITHAYNTTSLYYYIIQMHACLAFISTHICTRMHTSEHKYSTHTHTHNRTQLNYTYTEMLNY